MTANGWLQIALFVGAVVAVTRPLGSYMARVFQKERTLLDPVLRPVERLLYRITGVNDQAEMKWTQYAASMLTFSAVTMLLLYALERLQGMLAFNPQKLAAVPPALA